MLRNCFDPEGYLIHCPLQGLTSAEEKKKKKPTSSEEDPGLLCMLSKRVCLYLDYFIKSHVNTLLSE